MSPNYTTLSIEYSTIKEYLNKLSTYNKIIIDQLGNFEKFLYTE